MKKDVYKLIPKDWHPEIKLFTEAEFKSTVKIEGKRLAKSSDEIQNNYNKDRFDPRDGELIRAVDRLAAYIEAYLAVNNGIKSKHLEEAKNTIRHEYKGIKSNIAGIDFGAIYADFEN